jgi:hypothetical protein
MADKSGKFLPDYEKSPIVEEPANVETVSGAIASFGGSMQETGSEAPLWRGTYCLAHGEKILFSQDIEFKTADLPRWKPRVLMNRHRP